MSRNLRYSEDELRDQWAFIDALVDSQARALRSGPQDPEDDVVEVIKPPDDLVHELEVLRVRVTALETEKRELLERLRIAEMVVAPAPPAASAVPVPHPAAAPDVQPRRVETRIRDWWRRISR
ncbi:MAG TPA: hypothetical protein VJU79_05065 [Candidatus Dormibacteraeota bacterium]|nr:hypothetical protein [Candidatus Dormibacteraeota bacterium]